MSKQVTCIIVGAGHRSLAYADYAKQHPDKMRIVGVAEPLEHRRKQVAEMYGLTEDQCFESAEQLASKGRLADAVINGTMDTQHVPTSLPLLKAGYHMLLEKPFAVNEKEMFELAQAARKFKRKVLICHVLRYTPFYSAIRKKILEGVVGTVMNIQTLEHVSFHHMAAAYVRGKLFLPNPVKANIIEPISFTTWEDRKMEFSHLDKKGRISMVDVSDKKAQLRVARACGKIKLQDATIKLIEENKIAKGNVLTTAEIAAIQAAKRTSDLIPLCHPLQLTKIDVKACLAEQCVSVESKVVCVGQTGVEMEALTAVSVALLTVYDMCKAVDKQMVIQEIELIEKTKNDL